MPFTTKMTARILTNALLTLTLAFGLGCADSGTTDPEPTTNPSIQPNALAFDRTVMDANANGPAFVTVDDLNGDGKYDLIVSKFGQVDMATFTIPNGEVTAYLQGDSLTDWTTLDIVTEEDGIIWPNDVTLYDIDSDGDLDAVVPGGFLACAFIPGGTPCGSLQWFENTGNDFVHTIIEFGAELFFHVGIFEDIDGDGIKDLLTIGEQRQHQEWEKTELSQWFKGNTSNLRFETEARIIGNGMGSLPTLIDLDGDGDLDIASAEFFAGFGASMAWLNGSRPCNPAGLWERHVIDDQVGPSIQMTFIPNFVGDGKLMAVLSNHTNTAKSPADPWESAIYMYEVPSNPKQAWKRTKISEGIVSVAGLPTAPQAAPGIFGHGDADGDGDIDLIVSGDGDPNVYLIEQTAPGEFKTMIFDQEVAQAGGMKIKDLNGDGVAEIVTTGYENNGLYLFTQNDSGAHPVAAVGEPITTPTVPEINDDEIVVRVSYEGQEKGNLILSLFAGNEPTGSPIAFTQMADATFPADLKLEGVDPGTYTAVVMLDVAPYNIMQPGPEDITTTIPVTAPYNLVPLEVELGAPTKPAEPGNNPGKPGDVEVTVNYAGPETGDVILALFTSLPPAGPPAKYLKVPAVTSFPTTALLEGVPEGTYQLAVYLDLAPFNPAMWGDEDAVAETDAFTVGTAPVTLDVTLTK